MPKPSTPEEWKAYLSDLSDERLGVESIAANSLNFVKVLQEEGLDAEQIGEVFKMFALELDERDMPLSDRGPRQMVSYYRLVNDYPQGK